MKKIISNSGFIASLLCILGVVFKIQHWPGASPMLVLGLALFAILFLPFWGYHFFYDLTNNKSRATAFSGAALLSIMALAIMFKIQHWNGFSALLVLEFLICALLVFPLLMISKIRALSNTKVKLLQLLWYISLSLLMIGYCFQIMHWPNGSFFLLISGLALVIGYLPLAQNSYTNDENRKVLHRQYLLIPAILIFTFLSASTNTSFGLFADLEEEIKSNTKIIDKRNGEMVQQFSKEEDSQTQNYITKIQKVKELSDDLVTSIDKIKSELIKQSERMSSSMADTLSSKNISRKENFDIPSLILIGSDPERPKTGAYSANELKLKISVYQSSMMELCNSEGLKATFNAIGLNTEDVYINKRNVTWEVNHFYHTPLVAVITYLTLLQQNIRMTESSALETLNKGYVQNHDFKFNTRLQRGDTLLLYKRKN